MRRDRASIYVGSEVSEYLDREPSVERELSSSENELVSAAQRVRQLNAQLEHLHRVLRFGKKVTHFVSEALYRQHQLAVSNYRFIDTYPI